jgi:Zn-finger nucleic acid-binding protein
MRAVQVGSTPMYECASCASVWLAADTFMHLCLDREERGAVASIIAGPASVGVVPTAGAGVRYVRCPICKKMLNRENFGRQSGVVVDVCKTDGVWFERGELRSVLAFIDGGGLERARVREYARKAEELRGLEQAHESALRMAPHHQSTSITAVRVDGGGPFDSLLGEALRALFS